MVVTCFIIVVMLFTAGTVCPQQLAPAAKTTRTISTPTAAPRKAQGFAPEGSKSKDNDVILLLKEQNRRLREENAQLKAEIAALKAGN
jgi:hypothetical protein